MAKKTGKLATITGQSAQQIKNLSAAEARKQYSYLRKVIKGREEGFIKAGKQGAYYRQYGMTGAPSLKGLNDTQVKRQLNRMISQATGERSTITEYTRHIERIEQKRHANLEKVVGHKLSKSEADLIGQFLKDMQIRHGDQFKNISDDLREMVKDPDFLEVADLFASLGVRASMFADNFEYWKNHKDLISDAIPVQPADGSQPKASYTLKDLGLSFIS